MRELVIEDVRIADDTDCYVIAEIGHNHQGNLKTCMEMFDAARWAGANAVKLQKRDNKTLYSEEYYNSPYNSENAFGPTYGAHREALEFGFDEYGALQDHALRLGITFFATAFDVPSALFLNDLDMPAYKIASGDADNFELIATLECFDKPIIISTGGAPQLSPPFVPHAILQCTSGYPASYDELNLKVIQSYRWQYGDTVIGWSAHDTGTAMAPVAYALGARIIEKHFTLNRAWKGTDQAFSLEPQGMKLMIDNLKQCKEALGDGYKRKYDSEVEALKKQRKNERGQVDGKTT
jgi:sialic acid synthase